jgi:capsule polysaccharide export protein KpsE/RkpR
LAYGFKVYFYTNGVYVFIGHHIIVNAMGHRDREKGGKKERKPSGKKAEAEAQMQLVNGLIEEVKTIDSELNLLKQKMNLVIREINVLKHVVLSEKKEIKELEDRESQAQSRFESILNIVKNMKNNNQEDQSAQEGSTE